MKRRKMVESLQIQDMREKKARTTSQDGSTTVLGIAKGFTPTDSLSLIGFRDDIVISFLVDKLAKGRAGQQEAIAAGQSWILELPKISHKSLAALGASFFGFAYKQRDVGLAAIKIYGNVLSDMQKCISNREDVRRGGTVEIITLMCMFELMTHREGTGWLSHAQMLEHLLSSFGPKRLMTASERSLFLEQRHLLFSRAIMTQTETCMAQPAWKSIPWELDPTSKQPIDFLMDIMCDIANYRARLRELSTSNENCQLAADLISTLHELNDWWEDYAVESISWCTEVKADAQNSVMQDDDGPILDTLFHYKDVWTAHSICFYDATRILLLELLKAVLPCEIFAQVSLENPNRTPLLGRSSDTNALALEIIRSLDYTNRYYENFMGTFCVALVLDVAYKALEEESRIRRWLLGGQEAKKLAKDKSKANSPAELPLVMLPTCQISYERWFYQSLRCPISLLENHLPSTA
ncbi:hypothetical protein GLAREA_08335 [Glarea lozoyensis ATCC 20868]|uniref:Uncharacterized protein n=1 Tax=Glarea lozoyensis (strain ATCC 20868 / MF5171) TaxID=1116229 RepID=S3DCR0_GLAL2|nr:uncharacterized protein GLAREA_08335 [Glarea lozoyensis ATCC 20868]EPE24483.1 hypothetical protein GLAREA_08335 [Glarea lozoyensis ATCC 20868]